MHDDRVLIISKRWGFSLITIKLLLNLKKKIMTAYNSKMLV